MIAANPSSNPVPLAARLLISLGIHFYAVAVPILEFNATHVFNPAWVPHARLHAVWQLATHTSLGVVAGWWLWRRGDWRRASVIHVLVMGGFLAAFALRTTHGGSMVHADAREARLLGLNLGVFGFGLALLANAVAVAVCRRAASAPADAT